MGSRGSERRASLYMGTASGIKRYGGSPWQWRSQTNSPLQKTSGSLVLLTSPRKSPCFYANLSRARSVILLPVSRLREVWRALSRSQSGVKFNVRKDASRFLLLVPGNEPLDVTRYVGNYEPLR
jgi:hypothetical protein